MAAVFRLLVLVAAVAIWCGAAGSGGPQSEGTATRSAPLGERLTGLPPQALRVELQTAESGDLWRRRAAIAVSLVGIVAMAIVTLFQTGIVRRLPDPPIGGFDSNKVNSSDTAGVVRARREKRSGGRCGSRRALSSA